MGVLISWFGIKLGCLSGCKDIVLNIHLDSAVLQSIRCAYSGLFPPAGPQVWDPQLPWQPVPVHTVPLDQEYLLNKMHAFCPR